jgi:predicted DNA-binding transcriptional regulator AlpA
VTLLSIPELAARLSVSERTAYRVARDQMVHVWVRRCLRVPEVEVEKWLRRKMVGPEAACLDSSSEGRSGTGTGATRRARSSAAASAPATGGSPRNVSASERLSRLIAERKRKARV